MNQAKIYWDRENYVQVEKLFRQSAELCGDADVWRLNVAHTLFMQENKFREATSFYEPLVKQNYDNVSNFLSKDFGGGRARVPKLGLNGRSTADLERQRSGSGQPVRLLPGDVTERRS